MKRVCSLFLILFLALFLSGCGDDDDTATTTGSATDKTTTTTAKTTTKTTYSKKATYTSSGVAPANRGGGTTFRINRKGTSFGKSIKVVFSNGWTVTIPNTSKRFTKSGFIYRAGGGSYRNAETWTSHGGVFICANSGNKSKSLTIYY